MSETSNPFLNDEKLDEKNKMLFVAIDAKKEETVRKTIQVIGADPNCKDSNGNTPLHFVIFHLFQSNVLLFI